MEKVSILKWYRNTETVKQLDLTEVARLIVSCEYEDGIEALRSVALVNTLSRKDDGSISGFPQLTRHVPRLCFQQLMENRKGQRVSQGYTGLVLLEVNNLVSYDEACAVRQGAALMPQTLLAFVGCSDRSVKIVCRGALVAADGGGVQDHPWATMSDGDIARFHTNLYEKARVVYSAQLGVAVEKLEPLLERTCYIGGDHEAVFNERAVPFYVGLGTVEQAVRPIRRTDSTPDELVPGHSHYDSMNLIYEYNLAKAYDDVAGIDDRNERQHLLLTCLADYCCESGLPMAVARRLVMFKHEFRDQRDLVTKVFENAYYERHGEEYRLRHGIVRPLKNIPPETLLTMKIDIFLRANYELRKNVMRGVAEYRYRTGLGFSFRDLTEEARNSITMQALSQGIKCWDKDIRRYVNSDDIEPYDPMNDFLDHLPRWDGRDRVAELAQRVPTDYEEWPRLFHLWMRSMVAMWMGKGQLTGNALVPLLIGRQGCGKSSFCRLLMPPDLGEYYNDRISFKNEQDLNLGLTAFALINLDEFDKITQRQQIVLKYLVSTADLKYRPPYGKAYSSHRRYASFIGTTNEPTPLTDPSGSRRFVCVTVGGDIDFLTPVDYRQLYAQLLDEVRRGERYWPSKDEERALMHHNLAYQRLNSLGEMLLSLFRRPAADSPADRPSVGRPSNDCPSTERPATGRPSEGRWLSLPAISQRLKQAFPTAYKEEPGTFEKIGNYLNRPDYKFESRRRTHGMEYLVADRE